MLTDWRVWHGNAFENQAVLVTGGAGFIGSHLCEALITLGAAVSVIDDLSGGREANLESARRREQTSDQLTFIHGSILDQGLLGSLCEHRPIVFHHAALGSVPDSVSRPEAYQRVNSEGTLGVLEAARRAGSPRVIFAASSAAYGDSPELPKDETMAALPASPYAATKVAGEALMAAWASSYDLDTASLRYFNIFGPRQNANSAYAAVIAAFAAAMRDGRRPTIYGDGEQTRDFTYVDNVVHANLLAARSPQPLGGQVLNIATGQSVTVTHLAREMASHLDRSDLEPQYEAPRMGDVRHSSAQLTQAECVLGYRPLVDFETGLRETVRWYK